MKKENSPSGRNHQKHNEFIIVYSDSHKIQEAEEEEIDYEPSSESSDPFAASEERQQLQKIQEKGLKSKALQLNRSRRKTKLIREGVDLKNVVKRQRKRKMPAIETENKTQEDMQEQRNVPFEERIYYDIMETEKAVGKKILFEFQKGEQRMFKIKLTDNEVINLTEEQAVTFFPRLVIDFYKKIIRSLAWSNYD